MYHNIAPVPREIERYRSLYVSPAAFARQMGLLHRLGYRGMSMSQAMAHLRQPQQGKVVVITLDDGYVDNLESALPVLQRHGFTATCYVVSGRVGEYNRWDADKLGIRKPLMNRGQLQAWVDAGMEVGAHTRRHPHLTRCSASELHDEIHGSKHELEDLLGRPVDQFCYPYGDHDPRVVAATVEAGYTAATTTRRGRAHPARTPSLWELPRIQIARHHLLPQFAWRTLTGYEDRRR
ncbi:polysaccharide deacetylase family protein [Frateuria aurantia]